MQFSVNISLNDMILNNSLYCTNYINAENMVKDKNDCKTNET